MYGFNSQCLFVSFFLFLFFSQSNYCLGISNGGIRYSISTGDIQIIAAHSHAFLQWSVIDLIQAASRSFGYVGLIMFEVMTPACWTQCSRNATDRWQYDDTSKALMEHLNYFHKERPGNGLKCLRYLCSSYNFNIVPHGMPQYGFKRVENADKYTKQHISWPESAFIQLILKPHDVTKKVNFPHRAQDW